MSNEKINLIFYVSVTFIPIFTMILCVYICMKKLREELTRALIEANDDNNANEGGTMSFNELIKVLASKQDLKAFAFKTKAAVNIDFVLASSS